MKKEKIFETPDSNDFNPGVKPINTDFENYCGTCDNFPGKDCATMLCPFKEIVKSTTNWREIGCNYFWD